MGKKYLCSVAEESDYEILAEEMELISGKILRIGENCLGVAASYIKSHLQQG